LHTIARFIEDDSAATAVEYGLITALIAVGLIAAFVIFGDALMATFGYVRDQSGNAMNNAGL
jgi:pilus assembly protein Flp/PilA